MAEFAISNIAWDPAEDEAVAALMQRYGVRGLEIAPAKVHNPPVEASTDEIRDYRRRWEDRGISLCAMQALLFGAPYTAIFEGEELRNTMLDYLAQVFAMAGQLGATSLVFGSPKNRKRGNMEYDAAFAGAVTFFREAGRRAADHGVVLCIEPNPAYYECDFVQTSAEGMALVEAVDHPGFGLHLDAAGMALSKENIAESLERCAGKFRHFHVSEKDLAGIGAGSVDHAAVGAALKKSGYDGWISMEMRPGEGSALGRIEQAFEIATQYYRW